MSLSLYAGVAARILVLEDSVARNNQGVAPSDEQLVLKIATGDELALVELYRRYAPHLTALARRMLHDPVEADASVQAAFVEAWKTASHFDPHKLSAKTWLLTLSHRLFRHRVRERDLAPRRNQALATPHDLLEHAFFQGYTEQDLANLTGRPVADIKQTLRTALAQLSRDVKAREP